MAAPIRRVAKHKLAEQREYKAWARDFCEANPRCEIHSKLCTTHTQGVHHVIKRSAGGARMPGLLATEQGQVFVPACNRCNGYVEDHPAWARENGFTKRNPLRGMNYRHSLPWGSR